MLRKRAVHPSNPLAVRATRRTQARASSGSTKTDFSWAGSAFRKTAANAKIERQIGASNQLVRLARSLPPHQPSAAPAANESRLPNGSTQRAVVETENITQPTRNASPVTAAETIAGKIQRFGKNRISNGQNK